jgi:transketolase
MAFTEDVPKRFQAYGWHTQVRVCVLCACVVGSRVFYLVHSFLVHYPLPTTNHPLQTVMDGDSDFGSIQHAVEAAKLVTDRPSLISVKTIIGFHSAKQATAKVCSVLMCV